jgi:hypothetical protein
VGDTGLFEELGDNLTITLPQRLAITSTSQHTVYASGPTSAHIAIAMNGVRVTTSIVHKGAREPSHDFVVILENHNIVRVGRKENTRVRPNTSSFYDYGVNPSPTQYVGKQQGLFLHLIFSCLRLGRNRDRGATVPPVRFPDVKIRMGFTVELFSVVGRHSLVHNYV